jgi:hypothetical protein
MDVERPPNLRLADLCAECFYCYGIINDPYIIALQAYKIRPDKRPEFMYFCRLYNKYPIADNTKQVCDRFTKQR